MNSDIKELALFTSSQLQSDLPDLPQAVESRIVHLNQYNLDSTSKSLDRVADIATIAGFIIALAEFIINRIHNDNNKGDSNYSNLSRSAKKEFIVNIVWREFESSNNNIDDETVARIIEIQASKVSEESESVDESTTS